MAHNQQSGEPEPASVEEALESLLRTVSSGDPFGQAQINSLRAALYLMRGEQYPHDDIRRLELVRKALVSARSSVGMIGYGLSNLGEATRP
ncbi:hypothetical protein [Streptomyces virginiae]|uniref:hypothetical protein n=1 Tax=Streptomyces virginiae TaxID=1961 RepID=UPI0036E0C18B